MANRPPFRLSPTRIADGCPQHYQETELRGTKEYKGEITRNGTIFHDFMRLYGRARVKRKAPQSYDLANSCLSWVLRWHRLKRTDLPASWHIAWEVFVSADRIDLEAKHRFEQRLVLNRAWEAVAPGQWDKPQFDIFGWEADRISEYDGGKIAVVNEVKSGWQQFDYQSAAEHDQGAAYCGAWMLMNPQCERATLKLFGPLYGSNNRSEFTFDRDIVPRFQAWVEDAFVRLDSLYAEYGDNDWPAKACFGCRFCGLHPVLSGVGCKHPALDAVYGCR